MLPGIFQFCDTRKKPRCKLIGANGKDFGIGIKRTVIHFRNKEQQPVKGQFDKSTFNLDSRDHFKAGSINCRTHNMEINDAISNGPCSFNRIIARIYF